MWNYSGSSTLFHWSSCLFKFAPPGHFSHLSLCSTCRPFSPYIWITAVSSNHGTAWILYRVETYPTKQINPLFKHFKFIYTVICKEKGCKCTMYTCGYKKASAGSWSPFPLCGSERSNSGRQTLQQAAFTCAAVLLAWPIHYLWVKTHASSQHMHRMKLDS